MLIVEAEGGHKGIREGFGGGGRWAGVRIAQGFGFNWVSEPRCDRYGSD